ncbi:AMP-binding protein [Conexibacter arvalis]|uniref:Long-chain acyl-CoA synthetase n=1 Tax=Conexibacter arvalis TaxID=912552 RepID=A0A840IE63_9ACTN|nr:long-chain acyl-CoA synthetase [Conexibacter arvalis]
MGEPGGGAAVGTDRAAAATGTDRASAAADAAGALSPLLAERFAARAAERPDAVAVRDGAGELTYGALAARAEAIARALAARAGGRRIALLARADADSLATTLAAMRIGVSVVVIDRHLTERQLARVTADARPALVVSSGRLPRPAVERLPPELRATPAELAAEGAAAAFVAPHGEAPRSALPAAARDDAPSAALLAAAAGDVPRAALPAAAREDELLIGLTSGTSGEPKLFVRDQASWATTLDRSDGAFDVRPGDRVAIPGPLDHSHFFYGALHALTRGATVALLPLERSFAAGEAPTHVYLVPTLAVDLADLLDGAPRPSVREVVSSASAWPARARERLARLLPSATVHHFYGASELSFVALDSSGDDGRPPETSGRLFPGVEVEIRDGDGRPLPDGEQGIVHVRSDMLFDGYLAADGTLTGGPDGDGWATVGDLGTLRGEWVAIAGRASDTIICGGLKVEPGAVERALAQLPGVADAACVGLPDERLGAIPVAVLVLDGAAAPAAATPPADAPPAAAPAAAAPPLTRAAVRAHARTMLPQPSRPRALFVVDALPRTRRGKLDRPALVARLVAGEARELT